MKENFYNDLDLRYPEIGYNKAIIDRMNPGIIPFYIPVLIPYFSSQTEVKERQQARNIVNEEQNIIVSDIMITPHIDIYVPRELCTYMGQGYYFELKGKANMNSTQGSGTSKLESSHTYQLDINSSGGNTHTHSGTVTIGGGVNETRTLSMDINSNSAAMDGTITMVPIDRYISIDNKWVVMFIGGDITKPVIISRYYD